MDKETQLDVAYEDEEINALRVIVAELASLDDDTRLRVLRYLDDRYGE